MSNSNQLSKTISKNKINNCRSMSQEKILRDATNLVLQKLRRKYPDIRFRYRKKITKLEINSVLASINQDYAKYVSNTSSFIKPDGGFIEIHTYEGWKVILVSEAKKQGTNDRRVKKGFSFQAKGNAVERIFKNINEIRNYLKPEKIFPLVLFLCGCDFKSGSSIIDRLTSSNCHCLPNKLYIYKKEEKIRENIQFESICSLFVREKEWSISEVRNRLFKAAKISIEYYLK